MVVVRSDNRFLLIQEVTRNSPWYFPGGRVEPDETFTAAAAQRETLEEAGIPIIGGRDFKNSVISEVLTQVEIYPLQLIMPEN
ncbi:Hydrolase, NUDIX family protein (Modular protein) (fragment) [Planktothrix sp. PCC 11201]|uniref:NUDIX hydrolase n=1 Tax=Planktothrix sp. PCC 11201 TaxID=1729650 RepID=UPI00091E7947